MRLVADLHIHSRYSLATSPKLTPPQLDRWARIKGIDLVGTGDCTHPVWLAELREKLQEAGDGIYVLKEGIRREFESGEALADGLPAPSRREGCDAGARFVLTGEVCTIFSRGGKTRKVHHLIILPDFQAAAAFQTRLARIAKIESDGRPILGLDSRDLFEMLLESDERSILVPAHIWTPWFSALGGRSGFDSIDECYMDLAPRIGAIETGLSSNPSMNWAVSALDRFTIISNSDAHSPEKLGREATFIDMENSFAGLAEALGGGGPRGSVIGTVEFFPQEGKYHYDGHRACRIVLSPEESGAADGRCPVCGKPLTPGVLRRVVELADRPVDESAPCPQDYAGTNRRPYRSLIPLKEILSELLETGENSKKVAAAYGALIAASESEFALLLDRDLKDIGTLKAPGISGELLSTAIGRMRDGAVSVKPGYDGEYGEIRVFAPGERIHTRAETGLFAAEAPAAVVADEKPTNGGERMIRPAARKPKRTYIDAEAASEDRRMDGRLARKTSGFNLDPAQERAVNHSGSHSLIVAGPGTGKTAVLALRVAKLVNDGVEPDSILALTFTNKAAAEFRERIGATIGPERSARLVAATFHSFCLTVLRAHAAAAGLDSGFKVLGDEERSAFLVSAAAAVDDSGGVRTARRLGAYIEARKRFIMRPGERIPGSGVGAPEGLLETAEELGLPPFDDGFDKAYAAYRDALRRARSLDFDDLIAGTARLLIAKSDILAIYRKRFRHVFVDEYQDVNFAQYALTRLLVPAAGDSQQEKACELCVIGDPNQAIYGFRGADKRFIDRFTLDYPDAVSYRLTISFRCAPAIVGAAGRLVGADLLGSGAAVVLSLYEAPTDKAEAEHIAREIDRLIGGTRFFALDSGVADSRVADSRTADTGKVYSQEDSEATLRSLGECAVLIRAAALAQPILKALTDHGIPYVFIGERPWWEDEPASSLIRRLRETLKLGNAASLPEPSAAVRIAARELSADRSSVDVEVVDRLAAAAACHRDLPSFLDSLVLGSPADGYENRLERVAVMTIHASKGLEFDHVFVAGLEEGILPFTLYDDVEAEHDAAPDEAPERIEEERRLLYVAMTRARVGLHLSSSKSRVFRGRSLTLPPCRFLAEIGSLLSRDEIGPQRPRDKQLGLF